MYPSFLKKTGAENFFGSKIFEFASCSILLNWTWIYQWKVAIRIPFFGSSISKEQLELLSESEDRWVIFAWILKICSKSCRPALHAVEMLSTTQLFQNWGYCSILILVRQKLAYVLVYTTKHLLFIPSVDIPFSTFSIVVILSADQWQGWHWWEACTFKNFFFLLLYG